MSIKILISLLTLITVSSSQTIYYLLRDPAVYTIYNEYEQTLSKEELSEFLPYTPLLVVDRDMVMGDGISHAAKALLGKKVFFLLREGRGVDRFAGEEGGNGRVTVTGCETLGDTIEVLRENDVTVTPIAGAAPRILRGSKLVRVFRSNGRTYVRCIGEPPCYGWCVLAPGAGWKKVAGGFAAGAVTTDTTLPVGVRKSIIELVGNANETCRKLFWHMNEVTGRDLSIPAWSVDSSLGRLRIFLSPPYDADERLSRSRRELRRQTENLLLGTGFVARVEGGEGGEMIIIRVK